MKWFRINDKKLLPISVMIFTKKCKALISIAYNKNRFLNILRNRLCSCIANAGVGMLALAIIFYTRRIAMNTAYSMSI